VGWICNLLTGGEIDLSELKNGMINAIGQTASEEEKQIVIECLERILNL
jgi:hypothetical protein